MEMKNVQVSLFLERELKKKRKQAKKKERELGCDNMHHTSGLVWRIFQLAGSKDPDSAVLHRNKPMCQKKRKFPAPHAAMQKQAQVTLPARSFLPPLISSVIEEDFYYRVQMIISYLQRVAFYFCNNYTQVGRDYNTTSSG